MRERCAREGGGTLGGWEAWLDGSCRGASLESAGTRASCYGVRACWQLPGRLQSRFRFIPRCRHASTCPECQAKMRQREGQQRVGSMTGAAGSGAALDTLCDAAEMEMDACRGGTEPTEQATMVRDGGQPVAAVAGMQSNPVGGMPGPSPQLQGEATVARAPGSAHTAEVAASAPPLQQLKGQAPTAPAPNHAAGPSASAPPPPQLQEQASAALASNDAAGPAALAPLSSQLRGQSAAAQALNHVAEPLASAPPPPQVQGQAAAAQVAEQVAGLPASMLQPPQLRGQAGAAWAAEQVAGPPPSVPPLLQATQGAPVVPSAQQPIVPAKAAQLNPALPTIDTLRRRLQQTPVDHATVEVSEGSCCRAAGCCFLSLPCVTHQASTCTDYGACGCIHTSERFQTHMVLSFQCMLLPFPCSGLPGRVGCDAAKRAGRGVAGAQRVHQDGRHGQPGSARAIHALMLALPGHGAEGCSGTQPGAQPGHDKAISVASRAILVMLLLVALIQQAPHAIMLTSDAAFCRQTGGASMSSVATRSRAVSSWVVRTC